MNLAEILYSSADRHPQCPAVTDVRSNRSLSYAALAREAEQVAAFVNGQGLEPGQRIGILAPTSLAYLPAAFGLLRAGACLVPVATNLAPAEMAQVLSEVEVNGLLCWPGADLFSGVKRPAILSGGECDGFTFQWIDRAAEGPTDLHRLNPAFIRFTSGTTDRSKGVVLSHEATLARVQAADRVLGFSQADRIFWVLPLAYHFAVTVVAYVRAGAHILMCPDTLPGKVVEGIRHFGATVFYASPMHFERMSNLTPTGPLTSIRLAVSTSAPITPAVMDRFESMYGVPVGQAYGIIEAGLPCINLRTDSLPASSVGRPVPGYEIVVFSEQGDRLSTGEMGEIGVRGDGLFSAYYTPWRERDQITRDGWFLTGDVGRLDTAGALYLEGRSKSVIFVAGLKFFPEEVERCINRFPGVRESRVFGYPHTHLGQVPGAEIVLDSPDCDVNALRSYCARALTPYKVPLEFTIVPAIARTPGGKILRVPGSGAGAPVSASYARRPARET